MATIIEQRTPDWFAVRCGKATASRIADIIAKTKSGYSASRANYEAQLIAERLTGVVEEGFTSAAMQWGNDKEPGARSAYAFLHDADVAEIAFVDHPHVAMSGASPDGLVGGSGLVEIKCPNTSTHIDTLLGKEIPAKYITQMQWQMACCEREWCDFVSYDPRLPERMALYVRRIDRDDALIKSLEAEVSAFLDGVSEAVARLRERYQPNDEANRLVDILRAG
jgi:putative phage-type endonuclease